jgi:hypothetical protein
LGNSDPEFWRDRLCVPEDIETGLEAACVATRYLHISGYARFLKLFFCFERRGDDVALMGASFHS